MRILVAEDDPVVGDAYEEALGAGHNTVYRTDGVDDTVGRLGDGEVEVAILDVQLKDGTAWEVLDRISSPHPPFRVALVTAVDAAAPQRWSHVPVYRKPLDHQGLMRAVTEAVPFEWSRSDDDSETRSPNWLERLLLADEPPLVVSVPIGLVAIALVTLLMIPIREVVFGAIGASYTVVVLLIAAYSGITVGLAGALVAFLAYNFFTVYITKPFAAGELLARIRVALRRTAREGRLITVGAMTLSDADLTASIGSASVKLTPTEFDLLKVMALKEGFVMTADLLNDVWGPAYRTETGYVRVYMRRLRAKLDSVGAANAIESRPGLGYRLTVGAGPTVND